MNEPVNVRRRRFLRAGVPALTALVAGCDGTAGEPTPTGEPSATDRATSEPTPTATAPVTESTTGQSAVTPRPDDPIAIVLSNGLPRSASVTATLSRDGESVLEATRTVPADDAVTLDSGVTETGTYVLSVSVADGPSATRSLAFESYDLRMGSNVSAEISADGILFLKQE